jgi:hypothetical protein
VPRLFAAQAGDPGGSAREHAAERLQLAHPAAGLAQCDAVVHRTLAVTADELHHLDLARSVDGNRDAVALLDARDQREGLGVQLASVERRDRYAQAVARYQVGDDHVFGAEAGGLNDAPGMVQRGALQHRRGMGYAAVEALGSGGIQVDCAHGRLLGFRSPQRR